MSGTRWLVILAAWAIPALLASFETYTFWRLGGHDYPAWRAVAAEAPAWMAYALVTPAILALGQRLPLTRVGPRGTRGVTAAHVTAHVAAALVVGVVYAAVATAATLGFSPTPTRLTAWGLFARWYLSGLPLAVLTYAGVLGVGHALTYFAEARRRELEAAQLGAQLAEARLGALQMQLHPHFLFNSLNAVTVLARDGDTPGVAHMLTLLADLLRDVLRADAGHEIALRDELAFVRRYLDVERVRFSDRLQADVDAPPDLLDLAVPRFVLQPLVENALRHGLAPRTAAGRVQVGAHVTPEGLALVVQDDGVGLPAGWRGPADFGVGLTNTAARLTALYDGRGTLHVTRGPDGGAVARVDLPCRAASA